MVWLLTSRFEADPDLKIEKMADPDLFLLDPERFRILKQLNLWIRPLLVQKLMRFMLLPK